MIQTFIKTFGFFFSPKPPPTFIHPAGLPYLFSYVLNLEVFQIMTHVVVYAWQCVAGETGMVP
jgi:hypothetical protein